jgi:hypothetical protein
MGDEAALLVVQSCPKFLCCGQAVDMDRWLLRICHGSHGSRSRATHVVPQRHNSHIMHARGVACMQTETIGMVLDLTNSDKYYDPAYFVQRNVRYCKVSCAGAPCQRCT